MSDTLVVHICMQNPCFCGRSWTHWQPSNFVTAAREVVLIPPTHTETTGRPRSSGATMSSERCRYCELPGTTTDPFSGMPCCRVDFEILAGGLDEQPHLSYARRAAERMTSAEAEQWWQSISDRFGGARADIPGAQ